MNLLCIKTVMTKECLSYTVARKNDILLGIFIRQKSLPSTICYIITTNELNLKDKGCKDVKIYC